MRSCSAEALAEFFDCFFAEPDDGGDNEYPGDQGEYAKGGVTSGGTTTSSIMCATALPILHTPTPSEISSAERGLHRPHVAAGRAAD